MDRSLLSCSFCTNVCLLFIPEAEAPYLESSVIISQWNSDNSATLNTPDASGTIFFFMILY